jgi:hypothetical protein
MAGQPAILSNIFLAGLSEAAVAPFAVALVVVDGLAPRGAIVVSLPVDVVVDGEVAPLPVGVADVEDGVPVAGAVAEDDVPAEPFPIDDVDEPGLPIVLPSDVPDVSAALANVAAVMPIVDTIKPDTSLLFSRKIIVRSSKSMAATRCRNTNAYARSLPV